MDDPDSAVSSQLFLTATDANAASDDLKTSLERIFISDLGAGEADRSALLERIERFLQKSVESGAVLNEPADRFLVQALVSNWQRQADQLYRDLARPQASSQQPDFSRARTPLEMPPPAPIRLICEFNRGHRFAAEAAEAQRTDQACRQLAERAARWRRWRDAGVRSKAGNSMFGMDDASRRFLLNRSEMDDAIRQASALGLSHVDEFIRESSKQNDREKAVITAMAALFLSLLLVAAWFAYRDVDKGKLLAGRNEELKDIVIASNKESEDRALMVAQLVEQANVHCDVFKREPDSGLEEACLFGAGVAIGGAELPGTRSEVATYRDLGLSTDWLVSEGLIEKPIFNDSNWNSFAPPSPHSWLEGGPTQAGYGSPDGLARCRGWIWIGRKPGFPNVETLADIDDSEPGDRLLTTRPLLMRPSLPENATYATGPAVGQLPPGAELVTTGLPVPVFRPSGEQYWVEVEAANPNHCTTVFIQYVGDEQKARDLMQGLAGQGYTSPGIERISLATGLNTVRYFVKDPTEEAAAQQLAKSVADILPVEQPSVVYVPPSKPGERPPLEVWIDLQHR